MLLLLPLLLFGITKQQTEEARNDGNDEYFGVPLGSLTYKRWNTFAEVYAADEHTIIFSHFKHTPAERGCVSVMLGPARRRDQGRIVTNGVLLPYSKPNFAWEDHITLRRMRKKRGIFEKFMQNWPRYAHMEMAKDSTVDPNTIDNSQEGVDIDTEQREKNTTVDQEITTEQTTAPLMILKKENKLRVHGSVKNGVVSLDKKQKETSGTVHNGVVTIDDSQQIEESHNTVVLMNKTENDRSEETTDTTTNALEENEEGAFQMKATTENEKGIFRGPGLIFLDPEEFAALKRSLRPKHLILEAQARQNKGQSTETAGGIVGELLVASLISKKPTSNSSDEDASNLEVDDSIILRPSMNLSNETKAMKSGPVKGSTHINAPPKQSGAMSLRKQKEKSMALSSEVISKLLGETTALPLVEESDDVQKNSETPESKPAASHEESPGRKGIDGDVQVNKLRNKGLERNQEQTRSKVRRIKMKQAKENEKEVKKPIALKKKEAKLNVRQWIFAESAPLAVKHEKVVTTTTEVHSEETSTTTEEENSPSTSDSTLAEATEQEFSTTTDIFDSEILLTSGDESKVEDTEEELRVASTVRSTTKSKKHGSRIKSKTTAAPKTTEEPNVEIEDDYDDTEVVSEELPTTTEVLLTTRQSEENKQRTRHMDREKKRKIVNEHLKLAATLPEVSGEANDRVPETTAIPFEELKEELQSRNSDELQKPFERTEFQRSVSEFISRHKDLVRVGGPLVQSKSIDDALLESHNAQSTTSEVKPAQDKESSSDNASASSSAQRDEFENDDVFEKADQFVANRFSLPVLDDESSAFLLTNGASLTDYRWIGLYNQCTKEAIPLISLDGLDPPKEEIIGPIQGNGKNVSSAPIRVLNCNTVLIPDFAFAEDESGSHTSFFYVGIGAFPHKIEAQKRAKIVGFDSGDPIGNYNGSDIMVRLPKGLRTFDVDFLTIFNEASQEYHGYVSLPSMLVPPCSDKGALRFH